MRTTATAIKLEAPVQRLAHWMALRAVYMAARIQFVVKRRMKASNVEDVGQMRRSQGTSIKRMTKVEALLHS